MNPLPRFLIVDDVEDNRILISRSLLKTFPGALIQQCEQSSAAMAAAQHDRVSLVIVHRALDASGPEVIARLRAVNPVVPIIMVSGRESCPEAIEAGANSFLNYAGWQQIGAVVEHTLLAERANARGSKFPFSAVPAGMA